MVETYIKISYTQTVDKTLLSAYNAGRVNYHVIKLTNII